MDVTTHEFTCFPRASAERGERSEPSEAMTWHLWACVGRHWPRLGISCCAGVFPACSRFSWLVTFLLLSPNADMVYTNTTHCRHAHYVENNA